MRVGKDTVVTIEYAARLDDGAVVDSTEACGPVTYLHGNEQIFPALEAAVDGLEVGACYEGRLPPEESYGVWRAELVRRIPRAQLPEPDLRVGERYVITSREGQRTSFAVRALEGDEVVADFNNRAAGQGLTIRATVLAVRPATTDEIRRGSVR